LPKKHRSPRRYVDFGEVGGGNWYGDVGTVWARWISPRACLTDRAPVGDEAAGIALGQGLDGFGLGEHAGLCAQQRLDAGTQTRPVLLRQIEMAAEVEQGQLADLLAGTGEVTRRWVK
jgi:hypothetical protein